MASHVVAPPRRGTACVTAFASTLAVLMYVEVFSGILQSYFTPLLPLLGKKYQASVGTLSWAVTGPSLAVVVCTPIFTKLGDLYGHRRVLRVVVGLVAIASVIIAVAASFSVLVVGRVIQGVFAAYLPLIFGLVGARYNHEQTRKAIAYLSAILMFGALIGTVAVGPLVKAGSAPRCSAWA